MSLANVAVVLVSAPVAIMALGWLLVLGSAAAGRHPIWTLAPSNLSEAAAFRDGAATERLIDAGADPTAPAPVRPGVIARETATLTPIEAADAARRPELVQLLFDLGLSLDAPSWTRVWCGAVDGDVRQVLAAHRPAGAHEDCSEASTATDSSSDRGAS